MTLRHDMCYSSYTQSVTLSNNQCEDCIPRGESPTQSRSYARSFVNHPGHHPLKVLYKKCRTWNVAWKRTYESAAITVSSMCNDVCHLTTIPCTFVV